MITPTKYFVFSDESGSWHDPNCIYVRSWILVQEKEFEALEKAIQKTNLAIGCKELKWKNIAKNDAHFEIIKKFEFRIFLTISAPADIKWESKYKITKEFYSQVEKFNFGHLDKKIIEILKKKMFDDIKNILFLNFYEKTHIENANRAFVQYLPKTENSLIYKVDPPQMPRNSWSEILKTISKGVTIDFPKSNLDAGIQFADVIAGCIRSFLENDETFDKAENFIKKIRPKLILKSIKNPNPNLIFYDEINENLRLKSGQIWTI